MKAKVGKAGNALMMYIPAAISEYLDIQKGDSVKITIKNDNKIEVEKA